MSSSALPTTSNPLPSTSNSSPSPEPNTEPAYASPAWYLTHPSASTDLARLTTFHHGFKSSTSGVLVFPPLSTTHPLRILDVGTADGLWMRDVNSSLPPPTQPDENGRKVHTFVGTDINTAFFPPPDTYPENISYLQHDITQPLSSDLAAAAGVNNGFDLINLRMILIAAGPSASQQHVLSRFYALLKPGGYIQIGDCDRVPASPVSVNPWYHKMFECICAVCESQGADPYAAKYMSSWLRGMGAVELTEQVAGRAVGAKCSLDEGADEDEVEDEDVGMADRSIAADLSIARGFVAGAKALPPSARPLPDAEPDILVENLEKELREVGAYFPMRFIWGRKPVE